MQDPFAAGYINGGGGFWGSTNTSLGIILSDQFQQMATGDKNNTAPVYKPANNFLDLGVAFDYKYNNGGNTIEFSNNPSGYSSDL
jgi:hypothetical protein